MPDHDTKPDKKAYLRKYYREHAEHIKAHNRARYQRLKATNPHKLESCSTWGKNNPDKRREANKQWVKNNPEKYRAYKRRYRAKYRKQRTPAQAINDRMSTSVWYALRDKKSGRRWERLVGYTASELKTHLENLFVPGMTWNHFLRGTIHIDHRIPRSLFSFCSENDIEFKRCWALDNLQPLWSHDNISKQDRLVGATQMALGL